MSCKLPSCLEEKAQVSTVLLNVGAMFLEDLFARLKKCLVRTFARLLGEGNDLVEKLDIYRTSVIECR